MDKVIEDMMPIDEVNTQKRAGEHNVRILAQSGDICVIFGHWYIESDMSLLTYPPIYQRTCKLCGHQ